MTTALKPETPAADAAAAPESTTAITDAAAAAAAGATATTADGAGAPAGAAAPAVPETYDLKMPEGSKLDPAIVERTAAIARELRLSNEAGQKLLDQTVQDLTDREAKAEADGQAFVEAWKPGGAEFVKRDTQWRADALADAEVGGSPEKLATSIEQAQKALAKYGPELGTYLDETGLGSHPAALKFLARIGKAMGEGELVLGSTSTSKPKTDSQKMYPDLYHDDGTPKKPQ